jgi:hypothetical protein
VNRRQRRIVFFDDTDGAGEAVAGDYFHALKDCMDVDGLPVGRALVGKDLHAVHQPDDAVGLLADQPGERPVVLVCFRLQELRGAADAGERILDFMRQHRGKAGHGARGAAMGKLAVDLFGHRPRQQHESHMTGPLRHRRGVDVDHPLRAEPRRGDVDAVFRHRRAAVPHLLDEVEQRAAERHEMIDAVADQHRGRVLEEILRGLIGATDAPVRPDHHHRMRNGV